METYRFSKRYWQIIKYVNLYLAAVYFFYSFGAKGWDQAIALIIMSVNIWITFTADRIIKEEKYKKEQCS